MSSKEKYKINNGKLEINNKLITENGKYPFEFLIFDDISNENKLESGANGTIFKAQHSRLGTKLVVKISNSNLDKNFLEAIKNANYDLSRIIPVVIHAGVIDSPLIVTYSIMANVDKSLTLKKWLIEREKIIQMCRNLNELSDDDRNLKREIIYSVLQASLNVTSAFLQSYAILSKNNIVHGDLNPGNIMIRFEPIVEFANSTSYDNEEPNTIISFYNDYKRFINVGMIDSSYLEVKLIDLGTSQAENTNQNIGLIRDSEKIFDTVRKLLRPFFEPFGTSLKKFVAYKLTNLSKVDFQKYVETISKTNTHDADELSTYNPITIAGDMLRITSFLTLILGYFHNDYSSEKQSEISARHSINEENLNSELIGSKDSVIYEQIILEEYREIAVVNDIMYSPDSTMNDSDVSINLGLFDHNHLEAWDVLVNFNNINYDRRKYDFFGVGIRWDDLWKMIEKYFPDKELVKKYRIEYNKITFKES